MELAYAHTPVGRLHYARAGSGPSLLCLHQTPRSFDEYRELIPLLSPHFDVIAMDTPGMGQSSPAPHEASIECYADAAVALIDDLGLDEVSVVGHHTGGVIAIDLAARFPERIRRIVVSSTPYIDAAARDRRRGKVTVDDFDIEPDGTHLIELWQRRRAFYPANRPDVLQRCIHDAIAARDAAEGHHAVSRYAMERSIAGVRCPTLCVGASADPFASPELEPLSSRIANAATATIEGGTVGLLEDKADEMASLIIAFVLG